MFSQIFSVFSQAKEFARDYTQITACQRPDETFTSVDEITSLADVCFRCLVPGRRKFVNMVRFALGGLLSLAYAGSGSF